MVLSKLSKLPDLERSVGNSMSRMEFESHQESVQEIREDLDSQKARLILLEDQSSSGSGGSGEGISKHLKEEIGKFVVSGCVQCPFSNLNSNMNHDSKRNYKTQI